MKKLFVFMLFVLLVSAGCGTVPAETAIAKPADAEMVSIPAPVQLTEVIVLEGEGIVSAIERSCECGIRTFSNVGVLIVRNGQQVAHIDGLRALNFFELAQFVLFPGDVILWGKVSDVQDQAMLGVPTARGWYDSLSGKMFFSWEDRLWSITSGEGMWISVK